MAGVNGRGNGGGKPQWGNPSVLRFDAVIVDGYCRNPRFASHEFADHAVISVP